MRIFLLAATCFALVVVSVAHAIVLHDPNYQMKRTWSTDSLGIPSELGGLLFSGDGKTLYVVGASGGPMGALYAVPATRGGNTIEVMDLGPADAVTQVFQGTASSLDAGLEFGPSGTLFYTYWDANV